MTEPLHADDHATPITPAERDGLIPTHVTLRSELNELEQQNVAEADSWAFARKRGVLGEPFLLGLHRRMFRHVWRWAGQDRKSDRTNLGVKPHLIQPELRQALDDAQYWVDHKSYASDEVAVRFQALAVDVFGDVDKANRWLREGLGILDGKSPIDVARTESGARVVEQVLAKIDWGAAA